MTDRPRPPIIAGGQGRSGRDVIDDATGWLCLCFLAAVVLLLVWGCDGQ